MCMLLLHRVNTTRPAHLSVLLSTADVIEQSQNEILGLPRRIIKLLKLFSKLTNTEKNSLIMSYQKPQPSAELVFGVFFSKTISPSCSLLNSEPLSLPIGCLTGSSNSISLLLRVVSLLSQPFFPAQPWHLISTLKYQTKGQTSPPLS